MSLICKASLGMVACYILDVILILAIVIILYKMFFKKPTKTPTESSIKIDDDNTDENSNPEYIIKSEKKFKFGFSKNKNSNSESEQDSNKAEAQINTPNKDIVSNHTDNSSYNASDNFSDNESENEIITSKESENKPTTFQSQIASQPKPTDEEEKIKNFKHKIIRSEQVNKTEPASTKKPSAISFDKSESLINSIKSAPNSDTDSNNK